MSKLNPGVLVEAKECYMDQLKIHLMPVIFEGFVTLYEDAVNTCKAEKNYFYIVQFQKYLKNILLWNQSILETETNRILERIPLLMELVAAIFVSTVKILSCVKLKGKNENIRINIPLPTRFIHCVYINAAKMIYNNPMIVVNYLEVENTDKLNYIINKSIENTMNELIPLGSILKEYLENIFQHNNEPETVKEDDERMLNKDDLELDTDSDSETDSMESEHEIKDKKDTDFVNNFDSGNNNFGDIPFVSDPSVYEPSISGSENTGFESASVFNDNTLEDDIFNTPKDNAFGTIDSSGLGTNDFDKTEAPPLDTITDAGIDTPVNVDASADTIVIPDIPPTTVESNSSTSIEPILVDSKDPFGDDSGPKSFSDTSNGGNVDESFFKSVV